MSAIGSRAKYTFKVVFLGDGAVGKTSLIKRRCYGLPPGPYLMTIGADINMTKVYLEHSSILLNLQIWDLAGQPRFHDIHPFYIKGGHAFIFCFALNERESFHSIKNWKSVKDNLINTPSVDILVGTKCDLDKIISDSEILRLKDELKFMDYIETSALKNINVDFLFERVAERLYETFIKS